MKWFNVAGFAGAALFFVFSGCSLFEYHPYETNLDERYRNLNAAAIAKIQSQRSEDDTIRLISIGDTQRFYDEVEDFVASANKRKADFVLLTGDISDFGIKDEFIWVHDILKHLKMPYVAVIGNHDISGNGETVFAKMYGPLNDAFTYKRHKFILLNTNSREYHFNGRVPDIAWLQSQLADDATFDHAVVVSHIPPFDSDFDPTLEQAFVSSVQDSHKVNLCLHSHQHTFRDTIPYNDNIRYLISTSMEDKMYLLIKLYNGQYIYEKVYY